MGWVSAPQKKQKHLVVLQYDGPVTAEVWAQYRTIVKAIAKAHGVKVKVQGRFRKVKGEWKRVPRPKRKKK
jgi:hypothetical protein